MSEHEEEHQSDRVDEAEPVSLRDIEMIFAPGKPPPPRRAGSSPSLPEPEAKEEPPKPPRPPRKAAAPPDIGASDLAAFAAMGSLPPPHKEDDEAATPPPPPVDAKNAPTEPPPSEGRRRARVVPKLRKPLTVSFSETTRDPEPARPRADKVEKTPKAEKADDWDAPPDSGLRDLRALASVHPPAPKESPLDPDDVLALRNDALDQALQAPHVPPDLAQLVNPTSGKVHDHPPPPRPKNKSNSDAVVSALTAPPGELQKKKKKKKGPSSSRAPSAIATEGSASTRPSKAPTKAEPRPSAPAAAKEEASSKWPLYALIAAALFGGGYFVMRGSGPGEPPKRDQTPTAPAPTQESKPAQATPMPQETAKAAPVETEAPATAAPTATASAPTLFGKMPTATATAEPGPVPSTTPTAVPNATPSATPAAQGAGFDKSAATAALGGAVGQASGCKQPGDPSGVARVQVTFAPSGRVTVANISGPPFAGTATGGCIARAFKTASVPAFEGDPVTVSKTVEIP